MSICSKVQSVKIPSIAIDTMKIPLGFLKEVTEIIIKRYDRINKDYAFALTECLLSSCCWNIWGSDKNGDFQPNIWIQAVLPSGDGKSLPIDHIIYPIIRYIEANCQKLDEPYKKLSISDYTVESIIDFMNPKWVEIPDLACIKPKKILRVGNVGIIIKDEKSLYLKAAIDKKYMSGITEIDSLIYDGRIPERYTISHGLQEVNYCYKANLSVSTPILYSVINDGSIIQGGMNRYDMIVISQIDIDSIKMLDEDYFKGINDIERKEQNELDTKIIAEKLLVLLNSQVKKVDFNETASLLWRSYEFEKTKEAKKLPEDDLRRGYIQRQAFKALKRAILYTISRYIDVLGCKDTPCELVCTETEMETAIHNQEEYYRHWIKFLSDWKSKKPTKSICITDEADREHYLDTLKYLLTQYDPISKIKFLNTAKWNESSKHFRDTHTSLSMDEKVVEAISGEKSRALIKAKLAESDKDWFAFQGIEVNPRGMPPVFYTWTEKGRDLFAKP